MSIKSFLKDHAEEILTGFSIAGLISSVVMAVKATPRAMRKIEKHKEELKVDKLPVIETVKVAGPCYIPTGITMALTTVSIVAPVSKLMKSNSVLATGLMISEEARRSFEDKTAEMIGEKKVEQIKEEVAKEQMRNTPLPAATNVPVIGGGNVLVHELVTNQYCMSDHETVRQIINDLNYRMSTGNEPYITVNEYCDAFNIKRVPWGDDLKWDANKRMLDPRYYSELSPDGRPCLVVDFDKDDYLNL